jgi:hypothetical protein
MMMSLGTVASATVEQSVPSEELIGVYTEVVVADDGEVYTIITEVRESAPVTTQRMITAISKSRSFTHHVEYWGTRIYTVRNEVSVLHDSSNATMSHNATYFTNIASGYSCEYDINGSGTQTLGVTSSASSASHFDTITAYYTGHTDGTITYTIN